MKIRIGFGYDVHRLVEGRDFWLGGILLPFEKGSLGHSDADVLLHAICDAIFGAANMRDIGFHFPDTDPEYKGIDSKKLLKETLLKVQTKGYGIGNVDATICLEKPKIMNRVDEMQKLIADILEVDADDVAIKATTTEKMGFVGSGDGVSAYAVVLLEKK